MTGQSAASTPVSPILLIGAGRMGGALMDGWARTKAFNFDQLIIVEPNPSENALAAERAGARLNPANEVLADASTVLLAVKPQIWDVVAAMFSAHLRSDAVIVSIAAGVSIADLSTAFHERPIARVMPTTGVAIAKGVASIASHNDAARARAHALFDPVATAVDLDEALMDVATAVSGSAPAYYYAFVEAMEAAGVAHGLSPDAASALVRATMIGAAALLEHTGEEPAALRRQVTSPGGTTAAALTVLMGEGGFGSLAMDAVAAAVNRARELG